jgi:signal transduction histidine kinase/CheY-like chemotaxis protein
MLKKIFKNDYWRDPESNQAIIRLLLSVLVTLLIGFGIKMDYYPSRIMGFLFLAIAFNAFSIISLITLKYYPHSKLRTYLSIPFDVIGVSCAMVLTDASPFSPLFLLYPWMYVSYAVRYGTTHLYFVALSCITAFLVILGLNNAWHSHFYDAIVYLVFLTILPFYLNIILKRVITEREEKESALKVRNEFLATMSHEIRTPMSGIIGMTTLLERTKLTEQQQEYISSLRDTSSVLHSLINDILDLSKLEAKKTQLDLHPLNINEIIENTIQIFLPRAKAKNIKLDYQLNNIPENLIADANRLRQILLNLISNAIKFTQKGGVLIKVNGNKKENNIWDIKFEIKDTGSGIEHKHLPRVFDAFYQCNEILNLPHQGTGLGTTISKELVELMGGEIGLSSTYGKGSTFWFQLPLQAIDNNSESIDTLLPNNTSTQTAKSLNILVAEDDVINAKVITTFIKDEGHTVALVNNGKKALKQLSAEKYDMVFMDMRMPGIDGPEATKQWRELETEGSYTPIIALTANASPADRRLCHASGMDDFLIKPVSPEQLNNIIQKYN